MRSLPIWLVVIGLCMTTAARAEKTLVVDLSKSTVYAFDNGRLVRSLVINPGGANTPTRPGRYRISQKVRRGYRSNLVNVHNKPIKRGELGAPMEYWMRLGGTGMGFHRSSLWRASGNWGSHGCLRMSRAGARWMFDWAPQGTPVLVRPRGVDLASAARSRGMREKGFETASTRIHSRLASAGRDRRNGVLKPHRKTLVAVKVETPRSGAKMPPGAKAPKEKPVVIATQPKPDGGSGEPVLSRVRPVTEEPVQAPGEKN